MSGGSGKDEMPNKLLDDVAEKMRDEESIRSALNVFVWFIIVAVVALCEIMYIKMMVQGFPDGLIEAVAIVGALATGMSIIALYAGKNYWFSKGHQTWAAWGFTVVEITVLILNVLTAFSYASDPQGVIAFWKQFYPAGPIIALIGWGFILYLDRENVMRRLQRTMREREHEAEVKYEHLVHKTRMAVKTTSLEIVANKLEQKVQSAENLAALDAIADQIYQGLLGEISGKHYTQLPASRTVESTLASQPETPVLPARQEEPKQTGPLAEMATAQAHPLPKEHPAIQEVRDEIALNRQRDQQNGAK